VGKNTCSRTHVLPEGDQLDILQIILVAAGGWVAIAIAAGFAVMPSLRLAAEADRASDNPAPPWRPRRVRAPVLRSPAQSGYAGIVFERLLHHARVVLAVDRVCLLALDREDAERMVVVAAVGLDADLLGRRLPLPVGIAERALHVGAPVAADRVAGELTNGPPLGATAAAPVTVGGAVRGVLVVGGEHAVGVTDLQLLGDIATLAGSVFDHRDGQQLPYSDPRPEIAGLVSALHAADEQTEAHSHTVAALANQVGRELSLSEPDLFELGLTARLHDIGKIRVPTGILAKPGGLDERETALIRLHPLWGEEIVARIPGLEAVALLVRHHHERPDGNGYPDGLDRDRIPLASRIVAVCDAYSAMTADRPYRSAMSRGQALAELRRHAGTQFDRDVVLALARVLEREPEPDVASAAF
jgi:HD-GYP domain-containing protein (c-di-GMP phosphodiesterase class II)